MRKSKIIVVVLVGLLLMTALFIAGCDFGDVECPIDNTCWVGDEFFSYGVDCGARSCTVYDANRRLKSKSPFDRFASCDCY